MRKEIEQLLGRKLDKYKEVGTRIVGVVGDKYFAARRPITAEEIVVKFKEALVQK